MNDILQLKDIKKTYNAGLPGEISVLDGVDLVVEPGEIVALVAPSGAGKSTLLHIAGLLDTPDSGQIRMANQDLAAASDRLRTRTRRQQIGFIYQFHHLLPEFSALENITLPQLANGEGQSVASDRALRLLDEVGLKSRAHHRPAELSGGEQQRVAFCRAMANSPQLLLADEPTGNLDPGTSDTVFKTLLDMVASTGMSAVIATHNLDLAGQMDRRLRLENGRLTTV